MERHERKAMDAARDTLPDGFVIIFGGRVRPDDIVFCWTSGEWFRSDSPEWLQLTPSDVRDCVAVARRPGLDGFENAARRTYRLATPRKAIPTAVDVSDLPASPLLDGVKTTPKKALQDPQGLLF